MQVRRERQARERAQVRALARDRDEAREVEQLVVEVLADGVGRPGRVLSSPQRDRESPTRWRSTPGSRRARAEAGGVRRRPPRAPPCPPRSQLCGQPVPRGARAAPAPRGRRARSPARRHQQHQAADVRLDRVPRLQPQALHVDLAARDAPDRLALDRPRLDPQAGGQPHRMEPRSPVHQRHVDVERAPVAGIDSEPHRPGREVLVGAVDAERADRAGERRERRSAGTARAQPGAAWEEPAHARHHRSPGIARPPQRRIGDAIDSPKWVISETTHARVRLLSRSVRPIRIWTPSEVPAICVKGTYVRLDNLGRLVHHGARS